MIKLTKINDEEFFINPHQIEFMKTVPETIIQTLSDKTIYVKEDPDEVINKIIEYRKKLGLINNEH